MSQQILRQIKIRLLPTQEQEKLMFQTAHTCRAVWNWMLEKNLELEEQGKSALFAKQMQKLYNKAKNEDISISYMKDVAQITIRQVFRDMEKSYNRYYKERDPMHPYTPKTIQRAIRQHRSLMITEKKFHPKFKSRKKY